MVSAFKLKLFLIDGSVEDMYGEVTESQLDKINVNLRRKVGKRLYLFGVDWNNVNNVSAKKVF